MAINIPANRLALPVSLLWAALPFCAYSFGLGFIPFIWAYLVVGMVLTTWWLVLVIRALRQGEKAALAGIGLLLVSIGILFRLDYATIERLDFEYSYNTRMKIIQEIIIGSNMGQSGLNYYRTFPPIANGGEVSYYKNSDRTGVTVTFITDLGIFDHYSAFIYTTIPEDVVRYESRERRRFKISKKLREHWYRVEF